MVTSCGWSNTEGAIMMEEISWLMLLLLIPAVAILLGAVSARYGTLQQEIHHLIDAADGIDAATLAHLRARVVHFRNALVSLHLSVAIFAVSSVIGGVLEIGQIGQLPKEGFLLLAAVLGITCLVIGTAELIRESFRSQEVLLEHLRRVNKQPM